MNNYKEAVEKLGNKQRRKLENNTYLEKRDNGNIAVKLHQTDVVTYTPKNEVILSSGGWRTLTTKDRINRYSRAGISQKNNIWYVNVSADYSNPDKPVYFENPVTVFKDGVVITAKNKIKGGEVATKKKEKAFEDQKKVIKTYCKTFIEDLFNNKVKKPGPGDCWYCLMVSGTNKAIGDVHQSSNHILDHIKENYFVPSLLFKALETIPTSKMTKGVIGEIWNDLKVPENSFDLNWSKKEAIKNLYRYLLLKFKFSNSIINFKY